ncbi:hypothetical protein RR48_06878 [Papilio machaon]|uniref:Uncharacterized protein n=1 Tax=Papilio machaon TaxID=76193 RepID=A0A194RB36_PAPMA|nr:hypothetical protein RR48_06878 [Papilio machaon]
MESLSRVVSAVSAAGGTGGAAGGGSRTRGALVHASLAAARPLDKRGRHLTGTFCLTGDTMEGIIQCLVFLKAFSVSCQLLINLLCIR